MKNLNIAKINNLRDFKENWNGYNAEKFTKELCDFAISIINKLEYQPEIFPTGRSSIQFEYERDNGYLEFEIYSPKRIEMFRILESGEEVERSVDLDELIRLVKEFGK